MKYVPPIGGAVDDPYIDANPGSGTEGSPVPAAAIEHPMRELAALVLDAGLVPSEANLTQVAAAVRTLMQKQSATVSAAGGTADAINGTYSPVIAELTNGMTLYVRAGLANATATPTFTPAGGTIPAKTIVKGAGAALASGDIAGAGHWLVLQYDLALDKWVLQNPATGISTITQQAGEICFFAKNSAPTGFLKANGAAVSRTAYTALFAAIGTTFGTGDGSTTFNLPDLRGEFVRGFDDGRGVDSGRTFGSAQVDEFKSHSHSLSYGSAGSSVAGFGLYNSVIGSAGTNSTGGSETRPRNVALLACIKY